MLFVVLYDFLTWPIYAPSCIDKFDPSIRPIYNNCKDSDFMVQIYDMIHGPDILIWIICVKLVWPIWYRAHIWDFCKGRYPPCRSLIPSQITQKRFLNVLKTFPVTFSKRLIRTCLRRLFVDLFYVFKTCFGDVVKTFSRRKIRKENFHRKTHRRLENLLDTKVTNGTFRKRLGRS